jgi:hypothetical protein
MVKSEEFWLSNLWAPALIDNRHKSINHKCSSVLQSIRSQINKETNKCLRRELKCGPSWKRLHYQLRYHPLTPSHILFVYEFLGAKAQMVSNIITWCMITHILTINVPQENILWDSDSAEKISLLLRFKPLSTRMKQRMSQLWHAVSSCPQMMDIVDMALHPVVCLKSDFHRNSDFPNSQKAIYTL